MSKGKRVKKKQPFVDIYGVLLLVATLVMSIGYAEIVGTTITVETRAEASAQEGVFITDIVTTENNVAVNNYLATTMDTSIKLESPTATKKFTVTIYNKTVKPQVFIGVMKSDKMDEFDGNYTNTNISYTLGSNIVPHETILPAKDWITFDVYLGFNGQGTMPETLRSLLNFRFQEVPTIQISDIATIENVSPGYTPQEIEFTVSNQRQDAEHGLITNGVPLTYTIAPNVPALLTAKIYDENGQEVAANKEITISSEKAETHTYKLKVFWNNTNPVQGAEYNSGSYAGQTLASSIKITATPTDENNKYLGYERIESKAFEVKTAPMYFGISTDKTIAEMDNTTNAEEIILTIKNNDGSQKVNSFPVEYKLSIDNSKFTLLVDGSEIGEEPQTLGNTVSISQEHEIQLVSKTGQELEATEKCNLTIETISPYTKTETIELTIKDSTGPTAPVIQGGSTGTYATVQTISVSEVSTDVGTGINKYQYLLNSDGTKTEKATADVTTTETSQTFTQDAPGYYVYFRAVDKAGNVGEWSNAQQIYIDTQPPIVTANQASVTIVNGQAIDLATYFTTNNNGLAQITSIIYTDTSNGNVVLENTNGLAVGKHIIKCTVTKENGLEAVAEITIQVEDGVFGNLYKISDTEYHLIFNSTGAIAQGYTEAQLVERGTNIANGSTRDSELDISLQPWGPYSSNITKLKIEEKIKPKKTDFYFYGLSSITEIEGISNIDTSNVTRMEGMFDKCRSLTSLDLSSWDTRKVTYMRNLFFECNSLTTVDLSSFNTENVTNMAQMFWRCHSLTSVDVSGFDTSNATVIYGMFYDCYRLTSVDVSGWDTSKVTGMSNLFWNCKELTSIDVSNFDTSNVTSFNSTFYNCYKLTSVDISNFDTSNVTDMEYMFRGCYVLTSLDVSNFDTSKVTTMKRMFSLCNSLTSIDISNFDTRSVTSMEKMFAECTNLTTIYAGDKWTTQAVTNSLEMFNKSTKLKGAISYDASKIDANYANWETGYLTYKPAITLTPNTIEPTSGNVTVTAKYTSYLTGAKTLTCTGTAGVDYVINGTESVTVMTNNQTITATGKDAEGKTYTNNLTITNIDRTGPTITLGANSNTTWAQTGSVEVKLRDTASGIATGASVKYGWSTSNTTAPSSYTTATLPTYTAGTKEEVKFTAQASGLTGKYYLWVVPTTLKDVAGNSQTTTVKSTGEFYFDNEAPSAGTLSMKIGNPNGRPYTNNSWTNANVFMLVVNGSDSSGSSTTTWTIDGTAATGNSTTLNPGDGVVKTYTVVVTTTDEAGNTASNTYTVKIDKKSPTVGTVTMKKGSSSGEAYTNNSWTNQSVYVAKNNGADGSGESGHSSTTWTIAGTAESGTSKTLDPGSEKSATYSIVITTKDVAGNSASKTYTVNIDKKKPTISVANKVNGTTYNGDWTTGPISTTITFSDDKSGINASSLQWKSDSSDWATKSNTSTTTSSDSWSSNRNGTGYYRIYDNAGNYNEVSFAVKIDTNNPTVSANNSSVTITAGDSVAMSSYFTTGANGNAGISSTVYKIGSTEYTNTSGLAAGTYTVTCTVTKVTGKTASASMTLVVKAKVTLPTTETLLFNELFGSSYNLRTSYRTITIPEGVNVILVDGSIWVDDEQEMDWMSVNGGVNWLNFWEYSDGDTDGDSYAYVAVTPGKTYNITIKNYSSSRLRILYSQSINSTTPTIYDL